MSLLPSELLLVAGELSERLVGRPVQKVVQPDERTLIVGLAGAWLLVSLDRRHGRVHLIGEKPPGTGEAAPAFCMLLRKELYGLRLASVEAVVGERALGLGFARGPEAVSRRLLVFLYGAGAHVTLVDAEGHALGWLPRHAAPRDPSGPTVIELPPPRADDRPSRFPAEDISAHVSAHYAAAEAEAADQDARTAAAAPVRAQLRRLQRREEALLRDLARVEPAAARRRHADLLLAHLGEVSRGASEVTLPDDFEGGPPVRIPLDPALGPQENAARLYHEHRRLHRGRAVVEARLAETRAELHRVAERLAAIEQGDVVEPPAAPVAPSASPRIPAAPSRTLPYRVFRSATGVPILVGKGAAKNDQLTFEVARGNDLWLHTRDVPGAHVVVPLAGRPIDEATLLDAATLAVWFSPARPIAALDGADAAALAALVQTQADVTYLLRKFVRKPRRAAPGLVSLAGGKTLRVRLEAARLRRLLASGAT